MAGLVLSVLLAVVIGVVVVVVRQPQSAVLPDSRTKADAGPTSSSGSSDVRGDAAGALLERLVRRLQGGTRSQVVALAGPKDRRARRELATLHHNVRTLGVTRLTMRYVDESSGRLDDAQRRVVGPSGWVGDVQLAWRIRGFDDHDSLIEVPIAFRADGSGARFVTARLDFGEPAPLWMLKPVSVVRTDRALVVTTPNHSAGRFSALADQAVVDVRKVLSRWRGKLVVEVPGDQPGLTHVLGSPPGAYTEIAAVTTTADGSQAPSSPVHIFVNPRVFDPLGPRGSQIVMSHEATHVATRAALSSMPTWLLEGFADYVALAHVDLPVSVTASQILARVRQKGPPRKLPGRTAFDPRNQRLGASYEAAWLACRLLAEKYGERRLLAFYRASDAASSTARPFRSELGTDQRTFTTAWRNDLRRLAG